MGRIRVTEEEIDDTDEFVYVGVEKLNAFQFMESLRRNPRNR